LILGLLQELDATPVFNDRDLVLRNGDSLDEIREQAIWEVFFTRLGAIQEYGWHSGVEQLRWASDYLDDALIAFDWKNLLPQLTKRREDWVSLVIAHAKENGQFFVDARKEDFVEDTEERR
jgi:hypothetical protein